VEATKVRKIKNIDMNKEREETYGLSLVIFYHS
jgi:hypothetical protein